MAAELLAEGDLAWMQKRLENIPRYLFRITTPDSDGSTDEFWVRSKDARLDETTAALDCLSREDKRQVALELNQHLRWYGFDRPDNFVSWTTSLLFALQYIGYRNASTKSENSKLDNIFLCVIDTAKFENPSRLFVRDVDVIEAFRSDDPHMAPENLQGMWNWRMGGKLYFGEYLSQGALKVQGNIQMVSARALFGAGLEVLRPEFGELFKREKSDVKAEWANGVVRLRQAWDGRCTYLLGEPELTAISNITELFESRYKLAMAASFMAMMPRDLKDGQILCVAKQVGASVEESKEYSPEKTNIIAPLSMREVIEFQQIMSVFHIGACIEHVENDLKTALGFLGIISTELKEILDNATHAMRSRKESLFHDSSLLRDERESIQQTLKELYDKIELLKEETGGWCY